MGTFPGTRHPRLFWYSDGGKIVKVRPDQHSRKTTGRDWSRCLPHPLTIPKVMNLTTLDDVRKLMRHLPEDHRQRQTWRHVAKQLEEAAAGADTVNVAISLRVALMLEGVECRPM